MRGFVLLSALGFLLAAGGIPASGHVATPQAESACSISPLEPAVLEEIVAVGFEIAPDPMPSNQPVPAQAVAGIFNTLAGNIACTNANQPLRALAYFTDRYLAERFAGPDGADELGHLLAAATRSPAPAAREDQLVLVAVAELVAYTDGSVGATVQTANIDDEFTDHLVFIETAAGWRIDRVEPRRDESDMGTPAASGQEFIHPVG